MFRNAKNLIFFGQTDRLNDAITKRMIISILLTSYFQENEKELQKINLVVLVFAVFVEFFLLTISFSGKFFTQLI